MRYYINFDKTINQLVPYFFGGRKLILYLQALMSPLRQVNDEFVGWAKETRIEASMTSQIFKFEWYLNRKFSKYFASSGRIVIKNADPLSSIVYHESENVANDETMLVSRESENDLLQTVVLYRSDEQIGENAVSFVVSTPHIDTGLISEEKYLAMLRYEIDRYRLANKTYVIMYKL